MTSFAKLSFTFIAMALISSPAFAFYSKTLTCVPSARVQNPHFKSLRLQITDIGVTQGVYEGYQTQSGPAPLLGGTDMNAWMQLEKAPTIAVDARHNLVITMDFHARSGSDEDIFTLHINPHNGRSLLTTVYMTDCGDDQFHNGGTQPYLCTLQ